MVFSTVAIKMGVVNIYKTFTQVFLCLLDDATYYTSEFTCICAV